MAFQINEEESLTNTVSIVSNVRAPGEYKYYYCGDNEVLSDSSFLAVSQMWHTDSIKEEENRIYHLDSCYNSSFAANLMLDDQKGVYELYVFEYFVDYKNENLGMRVREVVKLPAQIKIVKDTYNTGKILVKIVFAGNNYIVLNEIDNRIILIDLKTGQYVTVFQRTSEPLELLYNVIDAYDEEYLVEDEVRVRTYVFLSVKKHEKKSSSYFYRYFIVQRNSIRNKIFYLHSLDFELNNGEPFSLRIVKIHRENGKVKGNKEWFYIFCFASSKILFQLITDYCSLNLHQMLKFYSKSNERNDGVNKDDTLKFTKTYNKRYWSKSLLITINKSEMNNEIKLFINANPKTLSTFVVFFESGGIATFPFSYFDSPETVHKKIFIPLRLEQVETTSGIKDKLKENSLFYSFNDIYTFRQKTICAYAGKDLAIASKNKLIIFHWLDKKSKTYEFYEETLCLFISVEGFASVFLFTINKVFKLIYKSRFSLFDSPEISNAKPFFDRSATYPLFELDPGNVWEAYINNIKGLAEEKKRVCGSTNEEGNIIPERVIKLQGKICEVCGKETKRCCSDCGIKYYCSDEHFNYDYYSYHFFECQFFQFFKKDFIFKIKDKEKRYIVLYNELIKTVGRVLNFIFTRIFDQKDYHYFLQFILAMISIMDNFGFNTNLSYFCQCNITSTNEKGRKIQKTIFYQEAIFFYMNLHLLKCKFALKSKLYNLADCYLKILKNDYIPKLTPKNNRRLISLKCEKLDSVSFSKYFSFIKNGLFFNIKNIFNTHSSSSNNKCSYVDVIELYICKHLMVLSLIIKLKIKLRSTIDVKDCFADIPIMFDDHFTDTKTKNIVPYCYFCISFYLVEIGKVPHTAKLLKRMINSFNDQTNPKLKSLTYYNLGLLQYALSDFKIGIHSLEICYKLMVENCLSQKNLLIVMETLGLAYLNGRDLFKAYVLIRNSLNMRNVLRGKKNLMRMIKLNVYLNYIIDLFEYSFITQARMQHKKKQYKYDIHQLIKFVLGEDDKELISIEQNLEDFIKVVEFVWNLPKKTLEQLHTDNPAKSINNQREETHHDRAILFSSSDTSGTSTFLGKDDKTEKEDNQEQYDEDVEIKPSLFDNLSRKEQAEFKGLKTVFLKRDIILRDSLGIIEKFNINFDPILSSEFQKIIEKLKSNFLLKEIFYCFQNEKWRDELYNYNPNSILFGLSKYLKLEKIRNMMDIEKSKCMDLVNFEDVSKTLKLKIPLKQDNVNSSATFKKSASNSTFQNKKSEELSYQRFKEKFIISILTKEPNSKDICEYININEEFLIKLYHNVYLNNEDHEFIFQNPLLILNYIYIDLESNARKKKEYMRLNESGSQSTFGGKSEAGTVIKQNIISNIEKVEEEEKNLSENEKENSENDNKNLSDIDETHYIIKEENHSNSEKSQEIVINNLENSTEMDSYSKNGIFVYQAENFEYIITRKESSDRGDRTHRNTRKNNTMKYKDMQCRLSILEKSLCVGDKSESQRITGN